MKYAFILLLALSVMLIGCEPEAKTELVSSRDTISDPVESEKKEVEPTTEDPAAVAKTEEVTPSFTNDTIDSKPADEVKPPEMVEVKTDEEKKPGEEPGTDKVNEATENTEKVTPDSLNEEPKEDASKKDEKPSHPGLTDMVFFKKCDFVFKNFVDKNGNVNYLTLRRKKLELLAAAKLLGDIPREVRLLWTENEKRAFLINAHNILSIKLVIDHYPIKANKWASLFFPKNSIKQIPGAREKIYFRVAGFTETLDELEEELLGKAKDPKYCFALSNSTVMGGKLRNEAYHPDKLDKQIDEQVKKYLADPKNLMINTNEKKIYLSNIFKLKYCKAAFEKSKYTKIKRFRDKDPLIKAVLNFIFLNIDAKTAKEIESQDYEVEFFKKYNWLLNEDSK